MYQVERYARVRGAVVVEGRSERGVAREYGLARDTVRKMLRHSIPPGYRRKEPAKRPKLGPWMGVIDAILEEQQQQQAKQQSSCSENEQNSTRIALKVSKALSRWLVLLANRSNFHTQTT